MGPLVVLEGEQVVEALLANQTFEDARLVGLLVVEQRPGVSVRATALLTPELSLLPAVRFTNQADLFLHGGAVCLHVQLLLILDGRTAAVIFQVVVAAAEDAAAATDDALRLLLEPRPGGAALYRRGVEPE